MTRALRRGAALLLALALALGAALALWHLLERPPQPAEPVPWTGSFDVSELLVLVDGDMAATAYADGILHPVDDLHDQLVTLVDPGADAPQRRSLPVSNTVMGWPGSLAVAPAATHAYVVAGRGQVPRSVERLEGGVAADIPIGRDLATVDLASGEVVSVVEVCRKPLSVDVAPPGGWLLIACGDDGNELTVVALEGGLPGELRSFDLDVPGFRIRPNDEGATYAVVHPDGRAAGVILGNRALTLVRFELDAAGVPVAATAEAPDELDRFLSVARWTRRGDHLLLADVAWGARPIDSVINGPGAIVSYALSPDSDERGVVSEATVSRSPEAFELSRDGTLLAVVNMERSYLPGGLLGLVPGRGASSLSLVGVDDASGRLASYGDPVGFRGVLPEDAAFDADGDAVAVVVYQDHGAPRSGGWLAFFEVDRGGPEPRLRLTDRRVPLPRGAHDLVALDGRSRRPGAAPARPRAARRKRPAVSRREDARGASRRSVAPGGLRDS